MLMSLFFFYAFVCTTLVSFLVGLRTYQHPCIKYVYMGRMTANKISLNCENFFVVLASMCACEESKSVGDKGFVVLRLYL